MTSEQNLPEALRKEVHSLYGIREVLSDIKWISTLQQARFTKIETIPTPDELLPSELNDIHQSN